MTQNQTSRPKIDKEYFEIVIAYNSIYNSRYLGAIVDFYEPDFITNNDIKSLMALVIDFFQRRNEVPSLTELKSLLDSDELKISFKNVLLNFKTLDTDFNEDELLENTELFFREKALYNAIKSSAFKLQTENFDVSEILPEFEKACNISLVDDLGLNYFESVEQHCDDLNKKTSTLSTGWSWLDERIGGGYFKEGRQLVVFVGRTNVGKSIFLGNTCLNLLRQNKKVLLITLEMPEDLYAKRFTSQISKVPYMDLHKHIDQLKTHILNFKSSKSDATLYIKEFPPKSVTVNHINSYIRKLGQKGHKFDAIVVDYLNLIKPIRSNGSLYDDVKGVAEQLRATSYEFNAPLITASQVNRKGMNNNAPDMDSISESVGVPFTADLQLSIWASEEDRTAGLINLGIQKNRNGPVNEYTSLGIDYNYLLIKELTSGEDEVNTLDNNEVNNTIDVINELTDE
jgi:replicative DNA helicase